LSTHIRSSTDDDDEEEDEEEEKEEDEEEEEEEEEEENIPKPDLGANLKLSNEADTLAALLLLEGDLTGERRMTLPLEDCILRKAKNSSSLRSLTLFSTALEYFLPVSTDLPSSSV